MAKSAPCSALSAAISCGLAITPARPASRAMAARRSTWSRAVPSTPWRASAAVVEAGEHGHAEQVGRGAAQARGFGLRRRLRGLHHGESAGAVEGHIAGFEGDHAAHGARDRVGDVVELEVEEERPAYRAHRADALRSVRTKIFEAELEAAHRRRQQAREALGLGPVARIEGAVERDMLHV